MSWQNSEALVALIYLWPYLIATLISAAIGIYAVRQRAVVSARFFALVALAEATASLGYTFELMSPTLTGKIFWDNMQWLSDMAVATAVLLFALVYTGHKAVHARRTRLMLAVVPLIVMLLIVTDPLHGWLHPAPGVIPGEPFSTLAYDFNALVLGLTLYGQGIMLLGILILLRHFMGAGRLQQPWKPQRPRRFYRHQIAPVIIGYMIPLVGSIISVSQVIPGLSRDITPFTFAFSNIVIVWGLFRHQLLMIKPVAYETVIGSIGDGVLILDAQGHIVDLNPAMTHILGGDAEKMLGKPYSEVLQSWPELAGCLRDSGWRQSEVCLADDKIRRVQDSPVYYDVHVSLLFDHRGTPSGQVLVLRDVTERKRVEQDIIRAKEEWERTFDAVPDLITILDKDYHILRVNKAMAERLERFSPVGQAAQRCMGQLCYACVHGTDAPPSFCPHMLVLQDKKTHTAEIHDGYLQGDFIVSVSPIFDDQGELYGSVHVARDITSRKKMEQELRRYRDRLEEVVTERTMELQREIFEHRRAEVSLRQSEEFNRSIIESSVDCINIVDLEGRLRFMSEGGKKLMGITDIEPYLGMPYYEFWEDADRQVVRDALEKARQGGHGTFEAHLEMFDGTPKWWGVVTSPIWGGDGTVDRVLVVSRDITERRESERQLRESELRYRTLFENVPIGIGLATLEGAVLAGNASVQRYFGRTLEELKQVNLRDLYKNPQERERLLAALRANGSVRGFEAELLREDGEVFHAGISVNFIELHGEKVLLTMLEDITERKRTEMALRESEQHLRLLMQQIPVGIIAVDRGGIITDANPMVFDLFGAPGREAILGLRVSTLPMMLESELSGYFESVLDTGESRVVEAKYESNAEEVVYLRTRIVPRFDALGEQIGAIQILEDVTERKRAEETLAQQAQELAHSHAELRRFAYVASHDLQEPVRTVSIYAQRLERHCENKDELDPDVTEFITYIVMGVQRIQAMIKGLQIYLQVDRDAKDFTRTDAAAALEHALFRLQEVIVQTDAVITHDPLPTLMADQRQLSQVFEYLIDNAIKFRGGAVPHIHIAAEETEEAWVFAVRDNGIGIEPAYFARIFEIFRRLHAWEDYPGIGVGLTLCKKIVERHGGRIWVESELGEGATFYFTMPRR
jgi:PAS domain S-box-containing protein